MIDYLYNLLFVSGQLTDLIKNLSAINKDIGNEAFIKSVIDWFYKLSMWKIITGSLEERFLKFSEIAEEKTGISKSAYLLILNTLKNSDNETAETEIYFSGTPTPDVTQISSGVTTAISDFTSDIANSVSNTFSGIEKILKTILIVGVGLLILKTLIKKA